MSVIKHLTRTELSDSFQEKPWLKVLAYGAISIVGIWVLGKAANLIANALVNFKNLNNAIKQ